MDEARTARPREPPREGGGHAQMLEIALVNGARMRKEESVDH